MKFINNIITNKYFMKLELSSLDSVKLLAHYPLKGHLIDLVTEREG